MQIKLLEKYEQETNITYKGENYLARDNGAVLRQSRPNKRKRPLDEQWTFGNKNKSTGYMQVATHVVHRIIAFAFLGQPPSDRHVVDHIDTNKCNNRSENLRWVTKLENILLNPITLKRIILIWGSLDNFFKNPQMAPKSEPNIDWMRTVSKEEAENCRKQLIKWAESDVIPKGGQLGDWVYRANQPIFSNQELNPDVNSITPSAIQRNWKTPTEFPGCPSTIENDPLTNYANNLQVGVIFSRDKYKETSVEMIGQGKELLSVLSSSNESDAIKPWSVAKITVENEKFVHEAKGTFFDFNGAKKTYFKFLGINVHEKSIDDYC